MDEQALQKFEKPETDFLKDKECLICLEPVDLEMNQIVMLPCKCANSAYHIPCIMKLLQSGENKNFCPHCKTKYQIAFQQMASVQNNVEEANRIYELRTANFIKILLFHLLSNSITNIIGICVSMTYPNYNKRPELNVLIFFYFFKLFSNYGILMFSKDNLDKIEILLAGSYLYKILVFGFLIYSSDKLTKNNLSIFLIMNTVLFGLFDLIVRYAMEYKFKNRVVNVNG
jgi:nitrate reductase NapE component